MKYQSVSEACTVDDADSDAETCGCLNVILKDAYAKHSHHPEGVAVLFVAF